MMRRWLATAVLAAHAVLTAPALAGLKEGIDASKRGDHSAALRELAPLAEAGEIQAILIVADIYLNGRDVPADHRRAAQLYRKAADAGDPFAELTVGQLYYTGTGVLEDPIEARRWFELAAGKGAIRAKTILATMLSLGKGGPQDVNRAFLVYQDAAEAGDPDAQNTLGALYEAGRGCEQDSKLATKWYRKAAELGNTDATYNLGRFHYFGQGVDRKDFAEAAKLFRVAGSHRHVLALYNLGVMYRDGQGVPQSKVVAVALFRMAGTLDKEGLGSKIMGFLGKEGSASAIVTAHDALVREISKEEYEEARTILAEIDRHQDFGKPIDDYLAKQAARNKRKATTQSAQATRQDVMFPVRPAKRPGVVTCNTRCVNGDCWRTYDDGHHVQFQAKRVFDPFSGEWKWDDGGC